MKKSPRDSSIGAQMATALQLMKRKNHKVIHAAGFDITMDQLAVLEMLEVCGEMNLTELSHKLGKQNANITRIVDKIEKRNLVSRRHIDEDRRAYILTITKKGVKLYKDVIPIVVQTNKETMSCISRETEAEMIVTLKTIIKQLST